MKNLRFVCWLGGAILVTWLSTLAADSGDSRLEKRAYALSGYIPKFHIAAGDPFDGSPKGEFRKYEDGIASYLREQGVGVKPDQVEVVPGRNAVIITDTPENLAMMEVRLRDLFKPDMQLREIDGAGRAFEDKGIFEGDRISRVSFLDEMTVRAFHGEVRKLEEQLALLPEDHPERKTIEARLVVARKYRDSAVRLFLEALKQQKALIEGWQRETDAADRD